MIHLQALLLCLAAFVALAFATRRQQRDIFGKPLSPAATSLLRAAGACILMLALSILVAGKGWSIGLVMFSGHTTMAAGIVFCALIVYSRVPAQSAGSRPMRSSGFG